MQCRLLETTEFKLYTYVDEPNEANKRIQKGQSLAFPVPLPSKGRTQNEGLEEEQDWEQEEDQEEAQEEEEEEDEEQEKKEEEAQEEEEEEEKEEEQISNNDKAPPAKRRKHSVQQNPDNDDVNITVIKHRAAGRQTRSGRSVTPDHRATARKVLDGLLSPLTLASGSMSVLSKMATAVCHKFAAALAEGVGEHILVKSQLPESRTPGHDIYHTKLNTVVDVMRIYEASASASRLGKHSKRVRL